MGRTVNPLALLSVVRIRSSPPKTSLCGSWSTLHGMVARSAKEAQAKFSNCAGYAGVAQW